MVDVVFVVFCFFFMEVAAYVVDAIVEDVEDVAAAVDVAFFIDAVVHGVVVLLLLLRLMMRLLFEGGVGT